MKKLINKTVSIDSRDLRIFEAMISNLNSFLDDADRKSKKSFALGVRKISIDLTTKSVEESYPSTTISEGGPCL